MSAQVKSQRQGKLCDQGINDIPSGLLPSSQHTLTGSNDYCNSPPLPDLGRLSVTLHYLGHYFNLLLGDRIAANTTLELNNSENDCLSPTHI